MSKSWTDLSPRAQKYIDITQTCSQLNCLPYDGGLMSQPAHLVLGMQMVLSAQNEARERRMKEEP